MHVTPEADNRLPSCCGLSARNRIRLVRGIIGLVSEKHNGPVFEGALLDTPNFLHLEFNAAIWCRRVSSDAEWVVVMPIKNCFRGNATDQRVSSQVAINGVEQEDCGQLDMQVRRSSRLDAEVFGLRSQNCLVWILGNLTEREPRRI